MTLVETLVVVSVLAVVALAVFSTMSGGFSLWERVLKLDSDEDIRIVFEKMTVDLGRMVRFSMLEFRGTERELSFPVISESVQVPGQPAAGKAVSYVSYYLDTRKSGIVRKECSFSDAVKGEGGTTRDLLKDAYRLDFKYLCRSAVPGGLSERSEIKDGIVPEFIRVTLIVKSPDRRLRSVSELIEVPIVKKL